MANLDVHELKPLLERVLAGDGEAFNTLLCKLRPYMHSCVREQLGANVEGPIDQSVIVASVLRCVGIKFWTLKGGTVPFLLAWIMKIAENKVHDEFRRLARCRLQPLGSAVLELTDPKTPSDSEAMDRAAAVVAALAQLPERQCRVVKSHWFDRQPDAKLAEEMDTTVNNIRQIRFRALKKLGVLLKHLKEAPV